MTPEEANPIEIIDENGVPNLWFTAKETAEIAKAYGRACLHSYMDKAADTVERFENLFEEWSK